MTASSFRAFALVGGLAAACGPALADNNRVAFPRDHATGVHYATVERGNITQLLFASRAAIEAAKQGRPFPEGSVITLVDSRGGKVHRYVVMEKRAGWGELSPPDARAGDWLFREFAPDGSPNLTKDGMRCMACHQSQAGQDFVFTVQQMKRVD